jgi:hypothetical protein
MTFQQVKSALRYAKKYNCTVDMLYLDDLGLVMRSMDDMRGYNGNVSSCIDITTKLCNKRGAIKAAKMLHEDYRMEMSHVHRCIAIYLGGLGTMDDEYIAKYPESNLSSLGSTSLAYNADVKNITALATLLDKVELPQYDLDSFSVAYQLNDFHAPTLDEMFDRMDDRADIALQYGETPSTYASYEGDMVKIRRKISTFIGKDIPKRYVEFIPKAMDRDGVIMARWNGRDFKV